jgi:hypothetical protein
MRKSTIKKLETIIIKMECLHPEITDQEINHQLIQLKSRMIDLLRRAENLA